MSRYINKKGEYAGSNIMLEGRLVMNPTAEQLIKAGYHEEQEPERTLEQAKAEKVAQIEQYNDSDEVNSFSIGGVPMWLTFDERARIRQSLEAYRNLGKTSMSKWFGGKEFTFPIDTWQAMLDQLSVYASEALNVTEAHKAAVEALTSIEEVDGYDYKQGYPSKLEL
jgi:hypothetical protein